MSLMIFLILVPKNDRQQSKALQICITVVNGQAPEHYVHTSFGTVYTSQSAILGCAIFLQLLSVFEIPQIKQDMEAWSRP